MALSRQKIQEAFLKCGICPFDPSIVLSDPSIVVTQYDGPPPTNRRRRSGVSLSGRVLTGEHYEQETAALTLSQIR